jgi:hypothetical protein
VNAAQHANAVAALRSVLDDIDAGRFEATTVQRAYLEGALKAMLQT